MDAGRGLLQGRSGGSGPTQAGRGEGGPLSPAAVEEAAPGLSALLGLWALPVTDLTHHRPSPQPAWPRTWAPQRTQVTPRTQATPHTQVPPSRPCMRVQVGAARLPGEGRVSARLCRVQGSLVG